MDTRKDSPGWSFMSWDSLRHPYHNIDGSETSRSQEGVYTRRAGAKAEFTFFGMLMSSESTYRYAVILIDLCYTNTRYL